MEQSVAHYSKHASPCLSKVCHAKGRNSFKHTQILRKSVNWDMHIHDKSLTATLESLMEVLGDKKTEEYLNPWNTELPDLSRYPLMDMAQSAVAAPESSKGPWSSKMTNPESLFKGISSSANQLKALFQPSDSTQVEQLPQSLIN